MGRLFLILALCACCAVPASAQVAGARPGGGIIVLSGSFGTLGKSHKLDIVAKLQGFCGSDGNSCDVFCSETSFGRFNVGRHPICRVTYRCANGSTRSVEAAREEPILLRCLDQDAGDLPPAGQR